MVVVVPLHEGILDAGDEAVELSIADTKGGFQNILGEGRVGGKEGSGHLGGARVLAVESGNGEGRLGLVGVELEVDKATGENKKVACIDGLVEEGVVGGGDEAYEQGALGEEEDLSGTGVHMRGVDAPGLEVDAGNGEALGVESTEGGSRGQVDHRAEVSGEVARLAQKGGGEVGGLHIGGGLAGQAIEGERAQAKLLLFGGIQGHAEVLQRVRICGAGRRKGGSQAHEQHNGHKEKKLGHRLH